ncbi:MAG: hypothetical protein KJ709_01740 [Nanoarchaeota archaeon]|nr:hypothetical protein [Nanoarchaeota archaeon]
MGVETITIEGVVKGADTNISSNYVHCLTTLIQDDDGQLYTVCNDNSEKAVNLLKEYLPGKRVRIETKPREHDKYRAVSDYKVLQPTPEEE